MDQTVERNGGNGWLKAIELIRMISVFVTPLLLGFIAYMQLAEDKRAKERWETPAFDRVVSMIVRDELSRRELATKDDIQRLEDQVSALSAQMQPITTYLIKRGIIE
jgi:hypothetical protein